MGYHFISKVFECVPFLLKMVYMKGQGFEPRGEVSPYNKLNTPGSKLQSRRPLIVQRVKYLAKRTLYVITKTVD